MLDNLSKRILSELDINARMSYSEIGKRLRVAKETVKYRIAGLEREEVIKGYYTVIDFSKIGYHLYRVYLTLQNTNPDLEDKIITHLEKSRNVAVLYQTNGPFHLAIGLWAKETSECERFWLEFKAYFGEYLSQVHFSILTRYIEFSRVYLSEKNTNKEQFPTISDSAPAKVDEMDLRILGAVSKNARAPIIELAKKTKLSLVTVRYRLKELQRKNIITGFRTMLDLNKIGMEYYKVDLNLGKFKRSKEIRQFIISLPNVVYAESSLITGDIEFDVEIENFSRFTGLMDQIRAEFPEEIKGYRYYSLVKNYKISYMPEI